MAPNAAVSVNRPPAHHSQSDSCERDMRERYLELAPRLSRHTSRKANVLRARQPVLEPSVGAVYPPCRGIAGSRSGQGARDTPPCRCAQADGAHHVTATVLRRAPYTHPTPEPGVAAVYPPRKGHHRGHVASARRSFGTATGDAGRIHMPPASTSPRVDGSRHTPSRRCRSKFSTFENSRWQIEQ